MVRRVGRIVGRMVPSGMVLPILRGPLRGRRFIAGAAAGEGGGLSVMVRPVEQAEMNALLSRVPEDGVAFDLGANVGLYTLLLARRCRRVYAFEPLPRNLYYLHRILDVNRVRNAVVVPCAVGERLELTALDEGENCALASLDPRGSQPTTVVSCDAFAARFGVTPQILKIDVEGAEVQVLRGASRLLAEHGPAVLLSTHGEALEAACVDIMREAGYPPPRRLVSDPRTGGASLLWNVRSPAGRAVRPLAGAASR